MRKATTTTNAAISSGEATIPKMIKDTHMQTSLQLLPALEHSQQPSSLQNRQIQTEKIMVPSKTRIPTPAPIPITMYIRVDPKNDSELSVVGASKFERIPSKGNSGNFNCTYL